MRYCDRRYDDVDDKGKSNADATIALVVVAILRRSKWWLYSTPIGTGTSGKWERYLGCRD